MAEPRVLVQVRGGVAEVTSDPGVRVHVQDWGYHGEDRPDDIPPEFADLDEDGPPSPRARAQSMLDLALETLENAVEYHEDAAAVLSRAEQQVEEAKDALDALTGE